MLVRFKFSELIKEPFIAIHASKRTTELTNLAETISQLVNEQVLIGYQTDRRKIIPLYQIIRVYTENKQVYCETTAAVYRIKQRIYQAKAILPTQLFIQLSSSEIVNFLQIKYFSLSKSGIYQVTLKNGKQTFTSRRYAQKIRKELLT